MEISGLPLELLIDTLRWLDVKSLKEARLTCRRWGEAGAHSLYRRLYFAPREDIMKEFTEITNKPAFAANVTEIVYDARMFWSHSATLPVYKKEFRRKFPTRRPENESSDESDSDTDSWSERVSEGSHAELTASHQRYIALLQKQTSIIASGQDLISLCAGMKQLPNLERVSLLDEFMKPDYSPFLWDDGEFEWYHWRSIKFTEGIAKPARWQETQFTAGTLEDHPWDLKGVRNLFQALSLHAPKLKTVLLGCQLSNLSTEIFNTPAVIATLTNSAPQLTILKVDCTPPRNEPSRWMEDLAHVLRHARKLQELHLTLGRSSSIAREIFHGGKWPQLEVLDLGDGDFDLETIKAICDCHGEVLRELRLRNIHLEGPKSWDEAAIDLGKCLKLHLVALSSMSDTVNIEDPYLAPERVDITARRLMQRIANSDLGMAGDEGFVVGWHKKNYRQMSGFIQIYEDCDDIEVEEVQM